MNSSNEWGPLALAAIPFVGLGFTALCSPMLMAPSRLAATLTLLGASACLIVRGWRRKGLGANSAVATSDHGPSNAFRADLLEAARSIRLVACPDRMLASTHLEFELWVKAAGKSDWITVSRSNSPGAIVPQALSMAQRLGLTVEVDPAILWVPLAPQVVRSPSADASPLPSCSDLPRYPAFALWLSVVGCLFVLTVAVSILKAQWHRAGPAAPISLILLGSLGVVALMLLDWGLRTRRRLEPPDTAITHDDGTIESRRLVTLGLLGPRTVARWGRQAKEPWLIGAGHGSCFLVRKRGDRIVTTRID